jgi:hypothetical protein
MQELPLQKRQHVLTHCQAATASSITSSSTSLGTRSSIVALQLPHCFQEPSEESAVLAGCCSEGAA